MLSIANTNEALTYFITSLEKRRFIIDKINKVPTGDGYFHNQLVMDSGELYHMKYIKQAYIPKETKNVSQGALDLDRKLKLAITSFGKGDPTIVGLNEHVIISLLENTNDYSSTQVIIIMGDGRILSKHAIDFYDFVMRYDTFIKFARQNDPLAMIPTGWLDKFMDITVNVPRLIS